MDGGSPTDKTPEELARPVGTPEEIAAARAEAEAYAAQHIGAPVGSPERRHLNKLKMRLARLSRKRAGYYRNKTSLKLAKATVAERIARRATFEAAGILEDSARVLRAGVNVYGRIASQELADYYRDRLINGDAKEKRAAAEALTSIYQRSLDLLMLNREARKRTQAIASWPAEGEKA